MASGTASGKIVPLEIESDGTDDQPQPAASNRKSIACFWLSALIVLIAVLWYLKGWMTAETNQGDGSGFNLVMADHCIGKVLIATRHAEALHNLAEKAADRYIDERRLVNSEMGAFPLKTFPFKDTAAAEYKKVAHILEIPDNSSVHEFALHVAMLCGKADDSRTTRFKKDVCDMVVTAYGKISDGDDCASAADVLTGSDDEAVALKNKLKDLSAKIVSLAVKKLGILPDPAFEDPDLTQPGREACAEKKPALIQMIGSKQPKVILVSPLQRTRSTADIMWADSDIPQAAMDEIGEKRSGFPCDTRKPISSSPPWPAVISNGRQAGLLDEKEARGAFEDPSLVEDNELLRARARHFLKHVSRVQGDVAIVTHKGFLRELEKAEDIYQNLFSNAESRRYLLRCSTDGAPSLVRG